MLRLELLMEDAQIPAAIGGQVRPWVNSFLPIAETGAENASHALVPRQLTESFRVRDADKLHRFGAVADIVSITVNKQVCCRTVNQLKSAAGNLFPVICWYSFSDNTPRYRNELIVNVVNVQFVDLFSDLFDQIVSTRLIHVPF